MSQKISDLDCLRIVTGVCFCEYWNEHQGSTKGTEFFDWLRKNCFFRELNLQLYVCVRALVCVHVSACECVCGAREMSPAIPFQHLISAAHISFS
jgi:hypothetical protein